MCTHVLDSIVMYCIRQLLHYAVTSMFNYNYFFNIFCYLFCYVFFALDKLTNVLF